MLARSHAPDRAFLISDNGGSSFVLLFSCPFRRVKEKSKLEKRGEVWGRYDLIYFNLARLKLEVCADTALYTWILTIRGHGTCACQATGSLLKRRLLPGVFAFEV